METMTAIFNFFGYAAVQLIGLVNRFWFFQTIVILGLFVTVARYFSRFLMTASKSKRGSATAKAKKGGKKE